MFGLDTLPLALRVLLGIVVVLMALPFLLGPLLLKAQHLIQRGFRIDAQSADKVPAEAREKIEADRPALEAEQFEWLGYYHLWNYAVGTQAWFGLWRSKQQSEQLAMSAALYQQVPQAPSDTTQPAEFRFALNYTEISGLFADDFCLCINNAEQSGAFDSDSKLMLRYPERSAAQLIRLYQTISARHPACRQPQAVSAGKEVEQIRKQMLKELDKQVKEGIYHLDAQQQYRLTWTGAIVMTMRHLPPFTLLRRASEAQTAARWARGTV